MKIWGQDVNLGLLAQFTISAISQQVYLQLQWTLTEQSHCKTAGHDEI